MIWRDSMHSDKLRDVLDFLEIAWFFRQGTEVYARDLLELSSKYIERLESFISSHSKEELNELEPKDFIEQGTGESYDKIVKLIKVAKKKQSLEQDFI